MSIDDDLQPVASITEGDRALDLFTDRYSFTRLLAERLNDPPRKEILFFHGAGGNGKSLLLKYLRTKVCKRLTAEQWQRAKTKSDDDLAKALENLKATQCLPVPTALLDFAQGATRQDSDPFYGLVRIREELAASTAGTPYRLRFPLHTYGCFLYLQKTNRLDEVERLFPFEEAEMLKEFGDFIKKPIPGLGVAISLFKLVDKYSGNQLARYQKRFRLDEDEVGRIGRMEAESELLLELPRLLAKDLNVAMAGEDASPYKPSRVVLFFDTHESFYGAERDHAENFFRDGWLRRLLRKLHPEAGIVVVVAGRDKPRWAEAYKHGPNTQIPKDYVYLKSVDDLAESDAEIFLTRAGVEDAELRKSLIRYASVEAGRVHPLHLGLCADVVLESAAKGVALVPGDFSGVAAFQEKSAYLIEQLLKYVDEGLRDAIRALSACRAFDFEIYQLLGEKLSFSKEDATFQRLKSFSFIRQVAQQEDEWFQIHDLLRRLGAETVVAEAHEVLVAHYQSIGEFEFIYHVNQLNWLQGVNLWVKAFEEALKYCRFDLCRLLLGIRQDLKIDDPSVRGITLSLEGDYFQTLSLFHDAKESYFEAIVAHAQKLESDPNCTSALNDKGNSLWRLGDLQVVMSEITKAQESYELAIDSYNAVLDISHSSTQTVKSKTAAFHNRGTALQKLAKLQVSTNEVSQARKTYRLSIRSYNAALKVDPHDTELLNSKGVSLRRLGDLQSNLLELPKAKESYGLSIESLNTILERTPYDVSALNNKGSSLMSLADLQKQLLDYSGAKASYIESIKTYDMALKRSPDHIGVFSNKGAALASLAELHVGLSENLQAIESYENSIEVYDTALKLAPDHVSILHNKGWSLLNLASLLDDHLQFSDIQENLNTALLTFDRLLEISPDNNSAQQAKEMLLSYSKAANG